ncbi:trichohyalin [Nematostella vectensis]|uniref:trichohyalin n=1 Tax=Nematostella vectensis TaxID=45351 RepID=UPI0020770FB7|nr:trichohyalin [Nematostella vectensis]
MGIPDLEMMFDLLDTGMRGYLTKEQLLEFHETCYFSALDPRQAEGALLTVCGHNADGRCSREYFSAVLEEFERRKTLEDKIYWDFRALDYEGTNRISIKSALFLFKSVHEDYFSIRTWKAFLDQRERPESDVSFDEIKIFLCNLPVGGPCEEEEFYKEDESVERMRCDKEYEAIKELQDLQADDATLAAEERERMQNASQLKHRSSKRARRFDHEGVSAILHDDEEWDEEAAKKARQRVTATDLLQALKKKYELIREMLLVKMLRHSIGEGMWTALSTQEQQERLVQLTVTVRKLRKDGKFHSFSKLPGADEVCSHNLVSLMGYSRAEARKKNQEEEKFRELMKEKGKSDLETEQEIKSLRDEALKGSSSTEKILSDLEKRYLEDKEDLRNRLRGASGHTITSEERLVEYALLLREQLRATQESKFESAAYSVGLAEDPVHNLAGEDSIRQQTLAAARLLQRKGRKLQKDILLDDVTLSTGEVGLVDLHEDVVKALERKHALEREVLIYMLQGRDSGKARSYARKLNKDERDNQLLVLRTKRQAWKERSSQEKLESRDSHRALLQEAVALVCENRRAESRELGTGSVDDVQVAMAVLSELQEYQDVQSQFLSSLPNKDMLELRRVRDEEVQAIEEEWLDCLSAVILGTEEGRGQEDELLKALEDKYDALRDKLLLEALEKQMGAAEWARLSEQERQARLLRLKLQEKRLRQQGKFDEAAALLGEGLRNAEALQALLGENRQHYLDRLKERLARREQRMREGLDPDEEDDETMRMLEEEEAKSSGNILKDLQNRFDDEKDALLRRLREEQDRLLAEKRRQAELARLRREKRLAEREGRFDDAALLLGLAERNRLNLEEKLRRDRERQEQLARDRLARRKVRRGKKEDEPDDPEPDKDDIAGWQDAVLKALERKHSAEQELLMSLLLDESSSGIREEARAMTEDERLKSVLELRDKREELDFGTKADQEMHEDILDMAAAYRVEIRRSRLTASREDCVVSDDEVHTSIMADLQEEQDKESEGILARLQEMSHEQLAELRKSQIQARIDGVVENIATVLLRYEGAGTDDEILKALDNKYDTLKDKLLLDALRKQLGDSEWALLSEQERQRRLMQLKLEEKRLRREGKMDELARLLGEGFAMDANLRKLMGDNKARYEEKLKERLARRRERLAQGLPPDDNDDEEGDQEDEGTTDLLSVLNDLENRYDDEKDALMRRLGGDNERFLNERQRQAELARLKRERLKAKQEDKFDAAALVLGLAERHQASAEERLRQDRLRQEQLAKERLARRRAARKDSEKAEDKLVAEGDLAIMQENLMKILENKHKDERDALVDLLQEDQADLTNTAEAWTQEQREARLRELKDKLVALDPADKDQKRSVMLEAAAIKLVSRKAHLAKSREDGSEVPRDEVMISLIADLQQEQDKESEGVLASMQEKDKDGLIALQKEHIAARAQDTLANVRAVLTRGEEGVAADEDELVQALESKYDALRDKLMAEALMKQVGEAEWKAMSERDRMAKLVQLKLEAKRLKQEGKMDELQKLFGDAASAEANLVSLMGENRTNYEKHLQERLAKRRQRLAEGMAQEEVDKLEAEEDRQREEELQKASTGNALLDLEKRLEEEKEALMAGLRGADAKFASERERQAALARMKRDERRARQEDTFDRAALVFGLAQAQQANLQDIHKRDRERQMLLARERLAARRQKRTSDLGKEKEKLQNMEQNEVEVTDPTNVAVLQEAVIKEMEQKHACERAVFEIMLNEERDSSLRQAAHKLGPREREDRLIELKEYRKQWRESSPDEMAEAAQEQEENLREATGLKIEIKLSEPLGEGEEKERTEDEIAAGLLADLQQQQDMEQEYLLQDLASKSPAILQQLKQVQFLARRERWYDNIAAALLGVKRLPKCANSQAPTEDELVEALEEKYDALKDKLLMEAMMKQMGEAQWAALSERERQARLVKLKLQEKRLREDGKLDEASRLLGEGRKHEAGLRALIGQSKERQQQLLKERLEKLRQRKASGEVVNDDELETLEMIEANGIESVDSVVLDRITGETVAEAEDATTANLIYDLQARYEEEKNALLASLRGQDTRLQSERQRQLELAKLRREQRRLKQEDNFDTAAILFSLAKQQEASKDANYKKDRARQEQLARDRLAALKAKRAAKHKVLTEEEVQRQARDEIIKEQLADLEADKLQAMDIHQGGVAGLQEAILNEVEKKHTTEQQALSELLQEIQEDADGIAAAQYLSQDERQARIEQLAKERQNWRMDSVRDSLQATAEQHQTEEERVASATRIAASRTKQKKLLHNALLLRMESRKQLLTEQGVPEDKLKDEVSVALLADLQEKQQSENSAMSKVLTDKEEDVLSQVKDDQRRARREGWLDNVAATILGSRPVRKRSTVMEPTSQMDALGEDDEEMAHLEEEEEQKIAELEEEMEREKQAKIKAGASESEINALMAELQRQQDTKRMAFQKDIERQRRLAKERLEARRRKRDEQQYEEDMAVSIVTMAEKQFAMIREKTMMNKEAAQDTLKDRLARRRAEREKKKKEEEERLKAEQEAEQEAELKRRAEQEKRRQHEWPLPPGFGMKREKTVIDVEVSEEKQREIVSSLIREHTSFGEKFKREQTRQEEMVKKRRRRKKEKIEQQEEEAAFILGLGERQKTFVEQKQKGERERQITMIKERIARVRHERTMTMKEPRDPTAPQGFQSFLDDEEVKGLSEDERMKRVAAKMEQKFKSEQRRVSNALVPPALSPDGSSLENSEDESAREISHNLLDEKSREKKLKERMANRRKKSRTVHDPAALAALQGAEAGASS